MKLYVIRHGESSGDVEDRYGGAYDDGLTEQGYAQARQMADELGEKGITRIVCSSLRRARETASVLQARTGAVLEVDARLRERNQYGALSGIRKSDARRDYPDLVESLKDRLFTAPDGESYADFAARVAEGFAEVAARGETKRRRCCGMVAGCGCCSATF